MKDSYYFPHDYNARGDDKILMLREKFNNEGYAVFFYCLETMVERGDGYIIPSLLGGLSLAFGVEKKWLVDFLNFCLEVGLLKKNETGFYNERLKVFLEEREKIRKFRAKIGKIGGVAKAKYLLSKSSSKTKQRKGKERKEKESKEKEKEKEKESTQISLPLNELTKPYIEKYGQEMIDKFLNYWTQKSFNGKKELWQKQKAFEVGKRLATWAGNEWNTPKKSLFKSITI